MTKMTRPEISNYRVHASCKVFRATGNTGGTIVVGISYIDTSNGIIVGATNNAKINLDNLTIGVWTQFDFYFNPAGLTWGNTLVGFVDVDETDIITGADAYVGELIVDQSQDTPGIAQITAGAAYTLRPEDNGKHLYTTTGGVVIPANSVVAIPIEYCIVIVNNSAATQTISKSGTLVLNKTGTGAVTTLTLAAYGMVTLLKTDTDVWFATGNI